MIFLAYKQQLRLTKFVYFSWNIFPATPLFVLQECLKTHIHNMSSPDFQTIFSLIHLHIIQMMDPTIRNWNERKNYNIKVLVFRTLEYTSTGLVCDSWI